MITELSLTTWGFDKPSIFLHPDYRSAPSESDPSFEAKYRMACWRYGREVDEQVINRSYDHILAGALTHKDMIFNQGYLSPVPAKFDTDAAMILEDDANVSWCRNNDVEYDLIMCLPRQINGVDMHYLIGGSTTITESFFKVDQEQKVVDELMTSCFVETTDDPNVIKVNEANQDAMILSSLVGDLVRRRATYTHQDVVNIWPWAISGLLGITDGTGLSKASIGIYGSIRLKK